MKKPLLLILAVIVLFTTGCKLDKPDLSGYLNTASLDSYLPVTAGTYWKYKETGFVTDTSTITITGGTSTFNSKLYYNAASVNSTASGIGYYYNSNHVYSLRQTVQGILLELQFLNDTTAVGHSWTVPASDNGLVNGTPAQIIGTVIGKGLSKVVLGNTYNNVIHTQLQLQYNYGVGFTTFSTYNFYLAQGIGIIETDSTVLGSPTTSITQLFNYSIK